jgi:hypothetical protein
MRAFVLHNLSALFLFLLPLVVWAHGISDEDKQRML